MKLFQTKYQILLFSFTLVFSNCKNQPAPSAKPEVTATSAGEQLPADFLTFYEKFHQDSVFQIQHIQWPLSGQTTALGDSTRLGKTATQWQQDKWVMHRPIDLNNGEFEQKWQMLGEILVIERIRHLQTGLAMERRFSKGSDGKWELIYYSEI